MVKSFEICDYPTRTGKFIARKNWFIVGSDDLNMRVFNYNTHEKLHSFEAHSDYIRCLSVHPSQPFVLSSADDMLIKLWDWEKGWKNVMVFEGHGHYVMSVAFNPKDSNTFASASLDKTVKVWNIGSPSPNYTLEGHDKGVNWVEYYHGGEKPFLVTAADDKTVKIWDYQSRTCVQTLEGHSQNVCVACFHPDLPIIITGSEDGTIKIWHANTYRLENTLNYGFERVWTIAYQRGTNFVGIGFDEGTVVVKLGREDPAVSMDSSGKVIWAKHNEILSTNISAVDLPSSRDGERLAISVKDLGNCEVYPQSLEHSPNGRFAVVCGDGEFIIYTALSWRNKSFGNALEFVWAPDSNEYAIRESSSRIKTFKAFKDRHTLSISFSAEAIFGGRLIGVRGPSSLSFFDWESGFLVRKIDIVPSHVYWAENGVSLCIASKDNFFILRYNVASVEDALAKGSIPEDGIETAFDVLFDIQESVKSGCWVGDCFIYCTADNRLNYLVGGQVNTVAHFDMSMFMMGYLPRESKVFVCDKDMNIYGYSLSLQVLEYQTAILRRDFNMASKMLPSLSQDQKNKVARFLEGLDLKPLAMEVTSDLDHKFDIALQLKNLDIAYGIAEELKSEQKWKQLGDFALGEWKISLTEECMAKCKDISGLLLIYKCTANASGLLNLANIALDGGHTNIAFLCYFLT
eukprot:Partr_v1_DN28710_c0_g1_i2_m62035 putative coatomer protein complex, subunit beta 2 (beta prime)